MLSDAACVQRLRFTSSPCRHRAPNASLPSATASETSASSIRPAASGDSLSRGTIATPNESSVNGSREYPVGKMRVRERRNCDDVVRAVDEDGELSCSSPDATDEDPRVVDSHRPRNPGLRGECRVEPPGVFGIGPRRSRRKMLEWIRAEDGLTAPDCMAQQRGAALVRRRRRSPRRPARREEGSGARLACDAKRQLRTRFDLSEAADELERDRVLENGIDEPVAQAMPHTEDLLEPGNPRPSLIRRAACEVGEIDRRAGDGVLAQTIDARGREQLRARGEDQPCASSRGRRARARDRPGYPPRAPRCTTGRGCRGCPADRRRS